MLYFSKSRHHLSYTRLFIKALSIHPTMQTSSVSHVSLKNVRCTQSDMMTTFNVQYYHPHISSNIAYLDCRIYPLDSYYFRLEINTTAQTIWPQTLKNYTPDIISHTSQTKSRTYHSRISIPKLFEKASFTTASCLLLAQPITSE